MLPKGYKFSSQPKVYVDENTDWIALLYKPVPTETQRRRIARQQIRRMQGKLHQKFLGDQGPLLDQKLDYYGARCRYCRVELKAGFNLSWDHAIPRSRGGPNLLSNLLPCCKTCNSRKSARTFLEYLEAIA